MPNKERVLFRTAHHLAMALRPISAEKRVLRILGDYGDRAAVTTSFGPTSAVLLHMAAAISPGIKVINLRHGYETDETLKFAEECRKHFDIDLRIYDAPKLPIPKWGTAEFEEYCRLTKIEPMRLAFETEEITIWLSGLIHDETMERRRMQMARLRLGAIAVYPILDWIAEDAIKYCHDFQLGINTNYFDPCKGPNQKLECGLHLTTEHQVRSTGGA